ERCVYASRRLSRQAEAGGRFRSMSPSAVTARPRVSVLIPAYNSPPVIVQAVTSALAQTIGDVEVIVSDDGSTQPVAERLAPVRDKRLRIIRSARNGGIA